MPGSAIRCSMVSILALRRAGGDTQMLVLRRAGAYLHGAWSYIAGHVMDAEAGWQAARRELYEETGLAPEELYATSFCEQFYSAQDDCIEVVPAFVARVAENAAVHLDSEHSAFRWISFDEAADLLPFGSQRELLAHVRREFIERRPNPFSRIAPA